MPAEQNPQAPAGRLAFFRPGRHTAVDGREIEFTPAQLAEAASVYDASAHEAPFVIGHPQLTAPAYGWAAGLKFENGTLYAEPKQVNADFAAMVNNGAFKKVSASWYLPDSPGNPKPGKLYLRHIGFLGAAPPALKGLPDASFAADDQSVTVEFAAASHKPRRLLVDVLRRIRNAITDADLATLDATEIEAPAFAAPAAAGITTETDMSDTNKQAADFAEREAALKTQAAEVAARDQALKDRETAIAKAEADARKAQLAEFAEGLAKKGQILPRHKAPLVEVLCSLGNTPISFAEGSTTVSKAPADVLKEFLGSLPAQIDFAEKSADKGQADAVASFAAPDGAQVDAARLEIHNKALAWQAAHPNTSYVDAVRAVGGR
jgi:hypothetical protein